MGGPSWSLCFVLCLCSMWPTITANEKSFVVDYINGNFLLNRQPYYYRAGEIHYFRMTPDSWETRLRSIHDMNLNAIQYYIPWNFHEIRPGEYIFHGVHNFTRFSQIARKQFGLFSILRIGPYICSEWENGGIPWFVSADTEVELRSNNTKFREYVRTWFNVLLPKIKPMLYINGGSVIMVQIENEFGLYGTCDTEYMEWLRDLVHEHLGPDVVLFTTDPLEAVNCGSVDGVLSTIDFGPQSQKNIQEKALALQKLLPGGRGPLVNSEYYTGWFTVWGQKNQTLPTDTEVVEGIKSMIDLNMSFSLYMAFGGTNFGYWSGSEPEGPLLTSYDYGAPIREDGTHRSLFNKIGEILPKISSPRNTHCNDYYRRSEAECQPHGASTKAFGMFKMNRVGSMSDLYDFVNCDGNGRTTSFEESNHPYGFIIGENIDKKIARSLNPVVAMGFEAFAESIKKKKTVVNETAEEWWPNDTKTSNASSDHTKPYIYSYSKNGVQNNIDDDIGNDVLYTASYVLIENPEAGSTNISEGTRNFRCTEETCHKFLPLNGSSVRSYLASHQHLRPLLACFLKHAYYDIGPIAVVDPDPDNNLSNSMPASPVRSDQYDTSLLNIKREIRTPKESLEERQKKRSKLQRTRFEASDHFTIRKDILTEELRCWKAKAELAEMQLNAEKKQLEKEGYRKRQEDEERQIRLNMLKAQLEFYVSFRDRNNAGEPLVPTSYSFVPPTAYHPVKHNPLYDLTNLP